MIKAVPDYLNILLIDADANDQGRFLHAITKAKTQTHVKIKTAKDGCEIAHALSNGYGRLPDIIFLAINLPNKDGHQILKEIRQCKKLKHVAIAIFTSSSKNEDVHKAHKLGANLYIKKPGDLPELTEMIEVVLTLDWRQHKPYSSIQKFILESKPKHNGHKVATVKESRASREASHR